MKYLKMFKILYLVPFFIFSFYQTHRQILKLKLEQQYLDFLSGEILYQKDPDRSIYLEGNDENYDFNNCFRPYQIW